MTRLTPIEQEVLQTAATLGFSVAAVESLDLLPTGAGLYSVRAKPEACIDRLRLPNVPGHESVGSRVLYLGKAEDSLMERLRDKHFATGETGRSTLRRTLAALWT